MDFMVDKYGITAMMTEVDHRRLSPINKFKDTWFPVNIRVVGSTNIRDYTTYNGNFCPPIKNYVCSQTGDKSHELYINVTLDNKPLVSNQFFRYERVQSGISFSRDITDISTCINKPHHLSTLKNEYYEEADRFIVSSQGYTVNLVAYDGRHSITISSVDESAVEQFYNKSGDNLTSELYLANCKIIFNDTNGKMSRADGPAVYHMPDGIKFNFVNGDLVGYTAPIINTMWVYDGNQLSMSKIAECAKNHNALVNYTGLCFEGPAYDNEKMKAFIENNHATLKK